MTKRAKAESESRRRIGLIWLPQSHVTRNQHALRIGALCFVTWEDISGARMTPDRVQALVASMPAETLLILVSAFGSVQAATSRAHVSLPDPQHQLANELCSPDVAARLQVFVRSGQRHVFGHEDDVLVKAKLAV